MDFEQLLTKFNLSPKAAKVYLALLERGASSIRQVAEAAGINRQTTHELLRSLIDRGIVTYYRERSREAYVAEDPGLLVRVADEELETLHRYREELKGSLAKLRALHERARGLATVHFYTNLKGVRTILEDVLKVVAQEKEKLYRVYSSASIAPVLHEAYPKFTKHRIERNIRVRVFGLGGEGKTRGLDERKQLTKDIPSPSYILIYGQKVAMISLDEHRRPRGVLIEDEALAETQRLIFDEEWSARG